MAAAKKRYKILKWTGGILLGLIVLAGVAALYLNAKWKPLLTEKIKEGVYNGSDHLYKIDFKDVHMNLFSGNLTLDSIRLVPDTGVYTALKKAKKAPAHIFELKIPKLELNRISILTAYFKKKIEMNAIVLKNPSINMLYSKVPKRTDTLNDTQTLYQQIRGTLKSIHVKAIKIVDADFDYYNKAKSYGPLNAIKHLDINVKDLLIDSLSQFDSTRLLYAKDINFELAGYKSVTKDKMYNMQADTINGSATAGFINVTGFKLIPRYPDLTFSRKYSTQKDRYDLSFSKIAFSGVNFKAFGNDGNLHAHKLKIGPAKVAIFLNRQLPPPNIDKGRNFPHMALKRLPVETVLDTLQLTGIDVAYTEFSDQTKKRGTMRLNNLRGTIMNVTNDSLKLVKNHHAYADLHTSILGTGKLSVQIDFNLTAANGAFDYKGQLGTMPLKVLNPLATNLGLVSIEKGVVQKMDFSVKANLSGSTGTVNMYYNDLKINLLKNKDGEIKEKGFLSFLANNILVINDNPEKGEKFRPATASFTRPATGSFFNLLWKGVFVGIREAVGIGAVPMKNPPKPKK